MAERFSPGEIVYWCHHSGHKYWVRIGMVADQYSDVVIIDFLAGRERRRVNGVPINEFENESHYKKLPKGWSYDTRLYEITEDELSEDEKKFKINWHNPQMIKEAYDKGYLVKDSTIFHGTIEAEITKEGYRIVKKYPYYMNHIDHVSIYPHRLYRTYEEAQKEVDSNVAEFERQAALSEREWSLEQIDKSIDILKRLNGLSDKEAQSYHDWFADREDVEDIETRVLNFHLQWKHYQSKKWYYVEL